MKEGAFLYLRVTGEDLDFSSITKMTGMPPSVTFKKGNSTKNNHIIFVLTEDCWQADYEIPTEQSLEDAIDCFLPALINEADHFEWSDNISAELWISVYPEGRYTSIQLSEKILKKLTALNIKLGIAITGLVDFYGEK